MMKVIYGINKIRKFKRPVVALGVFDGVHRGHQHILESAVKIARRINGTAVVLTFDPHPQRAGDISSLEHRLRLIGQLGIEICIVINFNQKFAQISAEDFVREVLARKIGAVYICVGKNFRFGRQAGGDAGLLGKLAEFYNFKLKICRQVKVGHQPISSTSIRKLILKGKLKTAQRLLGRRVSILGSVIRGASLARRLGFPTANINPHHEVVPPSGVYIVEIILEGKKFYGVCSVGRKPTFNTQYAIRNTQYEKHIEVHIFDFCKNIYGKQLEVIFIKKIRGQEKFSSLVLLAQQIQRDITFAKSLFSLH